MLFANFISCKKNTDTQAPVIELISPVKNTSYNTFDTIFIDAVLKDEKGLKFASAELQNLELQSVVTPFTRSISGNEYKLRVALVIDNIHLVSGKHFLMISAKDEENTTRKFIDLTIFGLPLLTKGYMVFEMVGNRVELHSYKDNTDTLKQTIQEEFKDGLIDNYYQQTGFMAQSEGPFNAQPLDKYIRPWDLPVSQGGMIYCNSQPEFEGIQIGYRNGLVSLFINEGNKKTNFLSEEGYYPKLSLINNDRFVIWQYSPGVNKIEIFHTTGTSISRITFNPEVVGMAIKNDANIYIGANSGTTGLLKSLNIESGGFLSIHEFLNEPIVAICKGVNGNVFIATNQRIYLYNGGAFQLSPIVDIEASHLAWDRVNGILLATTPNQLILYSPTGNPINSYSLTGTPEKLAVWYSK